MIFLYIRIINGRTVVTERLAPHIAAENIETLTDAASGAGTVDPVIAAKVAEQLDELVGSASPLLG